MALRCLQQVSSLVYAVLQAPSRLFIDVLTPLIGLVKQLLTSTSTVFVPICYNTVDRFGDAASCIMIEALLI